MNKIVFLSVLLFAKVAVSQGTHKDIEEGVTLAMIKNFEACNNEDIDATMDSCSMEMPDRDKFRNETIKVFKDKDIYYRLLDCKLLEVKFPYALAKIRQQTVLDDRSAESLLQESYRNSSALVPNEYVEYLNTFKFEGGEWKLLVIISEMRPFDPKEEK